MSFLWRRTLQGAVLATVLATMLCGASIAAAAGASPGAQAAARHTLDLAGSWRFRLDPEDVGERRRWWEEQFTEQIELPGSLQEQGYGERPSSDTQWMSTLHDPLWSLRDEFDDPGTDGELRVPFWLNPRRVYAGAAWYQRDIDVPESWRGRHVQLFLERVHWGGKAWLDGRPIGASDALGAPQIFDIGLIEPGPHSLMLRVDNRLLVNVRRDSHSVTDSTQTNWNGVVGRMELTATSPVYIERAHAYPNVAERNVRLEIEVRNTSNKAGKGSLEAAGAATEIAWSAGETSKASLVVKLGEKTPLWSEFTPQLNSVKLTLQGDDAADEREIAFGLREIETRDGDFFLNNDLLFLRGANEGCQFPLTGYPPTDLEPWLKILKQAKRFGLNHIRFHSFCPPEAAFTAADMLGVVLQPEASNWGQYQDPQMADFLERETAAIIDAYGNHPSFMFMSSGNEGAGPYQQPVREWIKRWSARDPRRLYTGTTGRPVVRAAETELEKSYLVGIFVGWGQGGGIIRGVAGWYGKDFTRAVALSKIPVVAHEIGQWCAYPSF
ncbi:MAG: hypothetical protein KDA61_14225, partial [Planctomycetales bacterium]|nr:hypothetical protein [Planctomycetales bacterium]